MSDAKDLADEFRHYLDERIEDGTVRGAAACGIRDRIEWMAAEVRRLRESARVEAFHPDHSLTEAGSRMIREQFGLPTTPGGGPPAASP